MNFHVLQQAASKRLTHVPLVQRFLIPVLAYPRSAHFVGFSYSFRRLYYSTLSSLGSGHHRIFLHDSSSKRIYMFHSKGIEVCEMWIKIVFIYRGILCHTLHFSSRFRLCVCSANLWKNVLKWGKLQRISPAQGIGSSGHCVGTMHNLRRHEIYSRWHLSTTDHVNQNTVHAQSSLPTSWCVNKERHAKYAERGYARNGIENRFSGSVEWMRYLFSVHTDSRFGHTPNPAPWCQHPSCCFTEDIVRCQFGRHRPTLVRISYRLMSSLINICKY